MTPEQIKHREFPVRLKGYDPNEVRKYLDQVAAVFRVAVADDDRPVPATEDDLTSVLVAGHEAAAKVVADAEREAASLLAKADEKHRQATEDAERAKHILERAQERSAVINADCHDAQQALADAEAKAEKIMADAREDASQVVLTERAEAAAREIEARIEIETRARLDQVDAAADAKLAELDAYVAERRSEADADAAESLTAIQARVDELSAHEKVLRRRVADAQAELRSIAARFVGADSTIDLTGGDPVIAFEGSYHQGVDDDLFDEAALDDASLDDASLDEAVLDEASFDGAFFPEPLDDDGDDDGRSQVTLEWNKPDWARPGAAIPVSH
jgi:DivIVA domain-containing protein